MVLTTGELRIESVAGWCELNLKGFVCKRGNGEVRQTVEKCAESVCHAVVVVAVP